MLQSQINSVAVGRKLRSQRDPRDDWSEISDITERRRRQNRLNQRAYRKRKELQAEEGFRDIEIDSLDQTYDDADKENSITTSSSSQILVTHKSQRAKERELKLQILEIFSKCAYESYTLGSPTADHLFTLTKVNVFRAFTQIVSILGLGKQAICLADEAISQFNLCGPSQLDYDKLPPSLQPTKLQLTVPHHPWLDFFPFSTMRDNLIRAGDFDDDELCADVMGFWDLSKESCSMVVWGDPCDPNNWEITEGFIQKWPWVVHGSPQLLEMTNRWRRQRGEKPILRYL